MPPRKRHKSRMIHAAAGLWSLACLVLLLSGCIGGGPVRQIAVTTVPPSAGSGGTLITTLGPRDPTSLDPALVGDVTSAMVSSQLFSGLVRLDEQLEVAPDLAERWELSADGRTYTFHLRSDARFADGTPMTSEDVRYSLERASDPGLAQALPASTYLSDIVGVREKLAGQAKTISGVQVVDPQTLTIQIDAPKSFFLSKLAHPTSFVVDQRAVKAGGATWTEHPNGSGPFIIERWQHDQQLDLARNPNYYRGPAKLDGVRFLIGAGANNPLLLYEQGKIDLTSVPSFALARIQDENNPLSKELVSVPQLSLFYIGLNVAQPPFDDPKVREAFTLLIDRAKLAELSLNGAAEPAYGILPPGIPGYDPAIKPVSVDVAQAKALISASRYGSPEAMPPIVAYGSMAGTLREVVQETLAITIEVRDYEEFGAYLTALNENKIQTYGTGWVADYPDPENFVDVLFRSGSSQNHSGYSNPEVDALLDKAAIESDEAKRYELYREAERRILTDAPIIPLYHDVEHTLIKPYVRGLTVTPMGILDFSTVELVR